MAITNKALELAQSLSRSREFLGPRAGFWHQFLDTLANEDRVKLLRRGSKIDRSVQPLDLEGWPQGRYREYNYAEKPKGKVGVERAIRYARSQKEDLRKLSPELIEGTKFEISPESSDVPHYAYKEDMIRYPEGLFTTRPQYWYYGSHTDPTLAHEFGHRGKALARKEIGYEREYAPMTSPVYLDEENQVKQFESVVRARAEGKMSKEEAQNAVNIDLSKYILGLGGFGLGATMMPEESEASPKWPLPEIGKSLLGKIRKTNPESLMQPISSASERLSGATALGKTIKEVRKGKKDWRIIIFEDGDEVPVDKSYIRELTAEVRTKKFVGEFDVKSPEEQLQHARNSLKFHQDRSNPWFTKQHKTDFRESRIKMVEGLGGGPPVPYIYVDSEKCYMPKAYAELLDKHGEVVIDKRKKK